MKKIIIVLLCIIMYYACDKEDHYHVIKPEVSFSEFIDMRDTTVYKCITIGDQTWMAENLRFRLPYGSLDGCYTYREEITKLDKLKVDYDLFKDSVSMAIERGEVIDPPGVPLFKRPSFLLPMYFDYYDNAETYMSAVLGLFPDLEVLLNRIYDQFVPMAITSKMEEADREAGGYYRTNGFLYTYEGALRAVPEGWRLPTDEDWKILEKSLGMPHSEIEKLDEWRGTKEGIILKSGEEGCGFNVLFSGARVYGTFAHGTNFINKGAKAYFWSSSLLVENDTTNYGITRLLSVERNSIMRGSSNLGAAYSVRCIKK